MHKQHEQMTRCLVTLHVKHPTHDGLKGLCIRLSDLSDIITNYYTVLVDTLSPDPDS